MSTIVRLNIMQDQNVSVMTKMSQTIIKTALLRKTVMYTKQKLSQTI